MALERPIVKAGKREARGKGDAIESGEFQSANGSVNTVYKLSITNLDFKPSVITVYRSDGYPFTFVDTNAPKVDGFNVSKAGEGFYLRVGVYDYQIGDGFFTIPISESKMAYNSNLSWVAVE